jgi:hypothetical protein
MEKTRNKEKTTNTSQAPWRFIELTPFFRFLLDIVLAVPLRFTDSDFPFGIFKLFFYEMYDSVVDIKPYINNKSLNEKMTGKCLRQA